MRVEHYSLGRKEKLHVVVVDVIRFCCPYQEIRKLMFHKNIRGLPAIWMVTGGNG